MRVYFYIYIEVQLHIGPMLQTIFLIFWSFSIYKASVNKYERSIKSIRRFALLVQLHGDQFINYALKVQLTLIICHICIEKWNKHLQNVYVYVMKDLFLLVIGFKCDKLCVIFLLNFKTSIQGRDNYHRQLS